ncbi:MAG: hypothetical protein AAF423_11735 [Pseudomonadota bacterium]
MKPDNLLLKRCCQFLTALSTCAALTLSSSTSVAVASQPDRCVDISQVRDADIQRNAGFFLKFPTQFCISVSSFAEHGVEWSITIVREIKTTRQGAKVPTIFLLHDNEQSAFDTALYAVQKYGGKLVAIEARDKRIFGKQDPNRNFGSKSSDTNTCRDMRVKPAPVFTKFLAGLRDKKRNIVITLHNNADGFAGGGGSGTISADRQSKVMRGMRAPNVKNDPDDALLLAGRPVFDANSAAKKITKKMHKAGINVIYEHVTKAGNDCSFSNYVVLNKLGQYYNIEAQQGHTRQQKRMLDVLMKHLGYRVRFNQDL